MESKTDMRYAVSEQQQDKSHKYPLTGQKSVSLTVPEKKLIHAVPSITAYPKLTSRSLQYLPLFKKKGEAVGYLSATLLLSRTNMLLA